MKNMKKTTYIWAITLVIAGLMITSAASIAVPIFETEKTENSINVEKLDLELHTLEMSTTGQVPLTHVAKTLDTNPAFAYEGDQLHPGFGRTLTGTHMASYRDNEFGNVIWTFSSDDGITYDDGVYYDTNSDYPSVKLWDGDRFFGTMLPNYNDLSGAPIYLFECTDPTNYDSYSRVYWDLSSDGWHDTLDIDIGVDNTQENWEWGFIAFVASTTYTSPECIEVPFILYPTNDAGYAMISWYPDFPNCVHADAVIDHITFKTYAVYDRDNGAAWDLLVRNDDFSNWDGSSKIYEITGESNLTCPAVAANDGNMVLVAETDENGNKDIICIYGNIANPQTSFIADSVDNEMFPDVRYAEDETYVCTFVKNNTLYKSITEDGGATWDDPEEVYSTLEVKEEYKTADICDFAAMALFEVDNGVDIDIYLENELYVRIVPILEITSIVGGLGVTATVKNTGNGPATDVELSITVTGGILGLIDKNASDIVVSLAVDEETTISSGIIFGLGAVEIVATVTCAEESSDEETAEGKQIIIFTKIS